MTAREFIEKHNIDLGKIHGNVGDYDGNILIENADGSGWTFWNAAGEFEKVRI
jgi:hypothetical protein